MQKLLILALALALSACATQYQKDGLFKNGGFKEEQLGANRHSISFRSNEGSSIMLTRLYALRRAAELSISDTKPGFILHKAEGTASTVPFTTYVNGMMIQGATTTYSVALESESLNKADMPAGFAGHFYPAATVLSLSQPYIASPFEFNRRLGNLNHRLTKEKSQPSEMTLEDLYRSTLLFWDVKDADTRYRLGYLAGQFKQNEAMAQEWSQKSYLPDAQIMVGLAYKLAGREQVLNDFMARNGWTAHERDLVTAMPADVKNTQVDVLEGLAEATNQPQLLTQRTASYGDTYVEGLQLYKKGGQEINKAHLGLSMFLTKVKESLENDKKKHAEVAASLAAAVAKNNLQNPATITAEHLASFKLLPNVGFLGGIQPLNATEGKQFLPFTTVGTPVQAAFLISYKDVTDPTTGIALIRPDGRYINLLRKQKLTGGTNGGTAWVHAEIPARHLATPGLYTLRSHVSGKDMFGTLPNYTFAVLPAKTE